MTSRSNGLRTITFWVLYDPERKVLIESRQFKHQLKPMDGCVLVKMKGHYVLGSRRG